MAGNKDWLPSRLADQATMFANIDNKIAGYKTILGLTQAQVDDIQLICEAFTGAYNYGEQCRAATVATLKWRDDIIKGTPTGAVAPAPPVFPIANMPNMPKIGSLTLFRELRDIILASPGYTEAIGEDLMIVAPGGGNGPSGPTGEVIPDLKCIVGPGYEITISGAMHGMDAMRIEWEANGGSSWALVGFLTRTPGTVIISPPTPGQPVAGRIRARYIHNNVPVNDYSPEYAVTVSQ